MDQPITPNSPIILPPKYWEIQFTFDLPQQGVTNVTADTEEHAIEGIKLFIEKETKGKNVQITSIKQTIAL